MDTNKLRPWLLGALLAVLAGGATAAIEGKPRALSDDINAPFRWTVDPGGVSFDFGAGDYLAPRTWVLQTSPNGAPVSDNSAWVATAPGVARGGEPASTGSTTPTIEFDYALRTGPIGSSVIQDRYVLILWYGVNAGVQASVARTVIRPGPVNPAFGFSPAPSARQSRRIDDGFGLPPAGETAPFPNSVVLMASAIAFLGFSHRSLPALKTI